MTIHPTAVIFDGAVIGDDVEIGPFTIVYSNVRIGPGTCIGSHCEIGYPSKLANGQPLLLGASSLIRSHSVFYEGSTFGDGLVTGHRVTVREKTAAGKNLQIGTLSDIQGQCQIGNYVRTHSNVHICQSAVVKDFVWIFPYVVLTNDPHPPSEVIVGPTLENFCVIATMSVILPGVVVGKCALVGASSLVSRDVPAHHLVSGNPATDRGLASQIKLRDHTGRAAYPWYTHFRRGYPPEMLESASKNRDA